MNSSVKFSVETLGSFGGTQSLADEGPSKAALELSGRETFLLRGRTLAAFVDKTKSEKWKALAELLGLEAVDELRLDLQRVRNDLRKDALRPTRLRPKRDERWRATWTT